MSLKLAGFKIKQSQRITVSKREDDKLEFVSSLEYTDGSKISITVPLHNQIPLELRRGETVYIKVPMSSFSLEFSTRVVSFTSENILLVNLEQPQSYKRVQRRGTVRFKTLLNVQIAPLPEDPKASFQRCRGSGSKRRRIGVNDHRALSGGDLRAGLL